MVHTIVIAEQEQFLDDVIILCKIYLPNLF